ncbi:helix-turn-helix transcriptional regulator [Pseudoalteromonas sp. BDTF-M6]|uniref:helix-turn-helix domain-containing protein n=1 Tax=Pseudoalteromonas sp. BDTF-M6 TaxID=2796132 RepID=UPI001BAE8DDF|nr:helix-turn-helix transcriptional regulator [Pseudoalteromonas sp. BDTF-M6]MBS3799093.1 helix-turn-helix transcriptional regulator [Pseudoalteromonas sp. BDTF-M6]
MSKSPFPKRLKEARERAKYTQEKLGIEAGIDEGSASARMNQYEKGVHAPDFSMVKSIAIVLNVPTAYFYCEEDELAEIICSYQPDE